MAENAKSFEILFCVIVFGSVQVMDMEIATGIGAIKYDTAFLASPINLGPVGLTDFKKISGVLIRWRSHIVMLGHRSMKSARVLLEKLRD
jgi:hypothetical protein